MKNLKGLKLGWGWNKGKKMPKEWKQKISQAKKGTEFSDKHKEKLRKAQTGKKLSFKTRKKLSEIRKGKNCNFWKGGITSENLIIRMSVEFRLWREAVFQRDNWTCQRCKSKNKRLHPHHIYNFSQYPKLRFIVNNGITLCINCHREFHKIYGVKNNTKEQLRVFLQIPSQTVVCFF